MIKNSIVMCLCILLGSPAILAQGRGSNKEAKQVKVGEKPYEMAERQEERQPLADFNDCTRWKVTAENCQVSLHRTREKSVYRPYSGKVTYTTRAKEASFTVELIDPIPVKEPWDCINFWNYGDHWLWGEPLWATAMRLSAIIEDASGKRHEISFDQAGYGRINYREWFLSHLKLENVLEDTRFVGFKFSGDNTVAGETHTLYLESVYVYKEDLKPLDFKPLPDKMPFPVSTQTILPLNKVTSFKNSVTEDNGAYTFSYAGEDTQLSYVLDPAGFLQDLAVVTDGKSTAINTNSAVILDAAGEVSWEVHKKRLKDDTLFVDYMARAGGMERLFACWYTIRQKSLVCAIEEQGDQGIVSEIRLGTTRAGHEAKIVPVPFLNYNYKERPAVLYTGGLFFFSMFDWYYSNASAYYPGRVGIEDGQATFNGGVKYIPLVNGVRNPLKEKLFINTSPDVQEVLPTISNPASPMRSFQADRLWAVNGGSDLEALGGFVLGLRSKGVEKVSIRYHEEFWRKGGESYTFKLSPNPDLGVEKIREYLDWVKSMDWRVGLYTNYTDFAPVNKHWNEDWVKRGPHGEWQVSWSRAYAPKPQVAFEQEALFAPKVHQIFNTNHSYCDVHTAVSPFSRVDYDDRVPGAGTFRHVINCYGLLLMKERRAYQGPVYSEGGNHWWYAGLVDGNYANGHLTELPVFPDFQLLKIHPLEMDAGNTGEGHEYLAYTLAYGNIGMLSQGLDAVKRYAMLQPLQAYYAMVPVTAIQYYHQGKAYNSSEAIKKDLLAAPQLRLSYASGFQVYVNFSNDTWNVEAMGKTYRLPAYGILAFHPDEKVIASSALHRTGGGDHRIDRVRGKDLFYLDTFGHSIAGDLGGQGAYLLKKEKFGWEIIPLGEVAMIDFDRDLLNIGSERLTVQAVDNEGFIADEAPVTFSTRRITFQPGSGVYKYKIIPAQ